MTIRCSECDEVIFSGRYLDYQYNGGWKQDIEGEMEEGAGHCDGCDKYFCAEHRDFDDGLCPSCIALIMEEEQL